MWTCSVPTNSSFETRQACTSPLLDIWCGCLFSIISPIRKFSFFLAQFFFLFVCLFFLLSVHATKGDDLTSDSGGSLVTQLGQSVCSSSPEHSDWLSEGRALSTLAPGDSMSRNEHLERYTYFVSVRFLPEKQNQCDGWIDEWTDGWINWLIDWFQVIGLHGCGGLTSSKIFRANGRLKTLRHELLLQYRVEFLLS